MTLPPLLIGLSAAPKDPAVESAIAMLEVDLALHLGSIPVRLRFADPLFDMMKILLRNLGVSTQAIRHYCSPGGRGQCIPELGGNSLDTLTGSLCRDWGWTAFGAHVWIDATCTRARYALASGHSVIVEDVCRPEEHRALSRIGGKVWRVGELPTPASGRAQHYFDAVIPSGNDTSEMVAGLRRALVAAVQESLRSHASLATAAA